MCAQRVADDLTSPQAKLEHVYDRLNASSPPHEEAPQLTPVAVRARTDQAPLTPSTMEVPADLNIFAGGSAATWLSNLSSSISELEGMATTPVHSPAKPRRSSSRPAPPPRDSKRSPAVTVASSAATALPTDVTPRAALAPLPIGHQQFPPGSIAERIARASEQPGGTPPGGTPPGGTPPGAATA